jgi:hypothetical protein
MTVSIQSFRQTFRMFADPDMAPDDAITYYIAQATNFLTNSTSAAGNLFDALSLDRAVSLYIAHYLTLDNRDLQASQVPGGIPGEIEGPATAKAIDKVSTSSDTKAVTWDNAAFWNMTRFGIEFINLIRMFGASGIQLGAPTGNVGWCGWH